MPLPSLSHSNLLRMWGKAIVLSMALMVFVSGYIYSLEGTLNTLPAISKVISGTSAFMMGIAIILGSFSFHFGILHRQLAMRRYIGLVGFFLAVLYTVMLVFINPDYYMAGFFRNLFSSDGDIILGLSAMIILACIALISNNKSARLLGAKRWRKCLRFSYLAYFLLVLRGYLLEHDLWAQWSCTLDSLPPPRLTITIFALIIFLSRMYMTIGKALNGKA